jgi:hypothetical protein
MKHINKDIENFFNNVNLDFQKNILKIKQLEDIDTIEYAKEKLKIQIKQLEDKEKTWGGGYQKLVQTLVETKNIIKLTLQKLNDEKENECSDVSSFYCSNEEEELDFEEFEPIKENTLAGETESKDD